MPSCQGRFFYRVFGLKVASDFYLPELISDESSAEVNIRIVKGKVPTKIHKAIWTEGFFRISPNELIFEIEDVAKYHLIKGHTITIEVQEGADDNSMKLYLLGTALGTLLLQRGIVTLHGSSVVINGGAVIFSGVSGAGKSTLSSFLRKKGHLFLADDISAVVINTEGVPVVQPGYPQQKLCSDSLKTIKEDTSLVSKVSAKQDKYTVPIKDNFLDTPVPLVAIFEVIPKECKRVEINQAFGIDKLNIILRNIYRETVLKVLGTNSGYFRQCLDICRDTKVFKLIRPQGVFSLEEQAFLIKERVNRK